MAGRARLVSRQSSYSAMKFVLTLLPLFLTACSSLKIPPTNQPSDFGMTVKFTKGDGRSVSPNLALIDLATGATLASGESIFTPDVVEIFGEPTKGERFVVMASPTGKTIAIHEDGSESSPDHRITVFEKASGDNWKTHSVQPEREDGPIYGFTAESLGIDDEYLYFRFGPKKPARRQKLNLLSNW